MTFNTQTTLAGFAEHGYVLRQRETLALASLLNQRQGVRALLIEGEPGAGKTSLGEYLAKVLDVEDQLVMYMFHNWTGDARFSKASTRLPPLRATKTMCSCPACLRGCSN